MGALKLQREKPISIKLTSSALTWRRVGALVAFEIEQRGWTKTETCERATGAVTDAPMCYATLQKMLEGDYHRGGPFIATLERVFCRAFRSSGYEIVLRSKGAELRRG